MVKGSGAAAATQLGRRTQWPWLADADAADRGWPINCPLTATTTATTTTTQRTHTKPRGDKQVKVLFPLSLSLYSFRWTLDEQKYPAAKHHHHQQVMNDEQRMEKAAAASTAAYSLPITPNDDEGDDDDDLVSTWSEGSNRTELLDLLLLLSPGGCQEGHNKSGPWKLNMRYL